MKTKQTLSKTCQELCENKGQSAVFDFINSMSRKKMTSLKVDWELCGACECSSPAQEHICLVCGQETKTEKVDNELLTCAKLLVWTLEQETPTRNEIFERIERIREISLK